MRERAAARTPCEGSGCHNFSIFARTSSATMALQSMREGVVCRWGRCRLLHYPTFLVGNRTRALAFEIMALHVAVTLRRFGSPVRP
jgi:hypothetical protein